MKIFNSSSKGGSSSGGKSSILNSSSGFTLVELIVAIGLFSVIVSVAMGGLVRALRTQRQVSALIAVNNNASLAIEQMVREIRTGRLFCDGETAPLCQTSSELVFINARTETIGYRLSGGAIERGVGGDFQKITGGNVSVRYMNFVIFGEDESDGYPPRITISVGVGANEVGTSDITTRLQTTVSARTLDG